MIAKNKTIFIGLFALFSLALFLLPANSALAQSCPPGFNYCNPPGACLPEQGENPDCTNQNRGTDQCGNCTGCLEGYIECDGSCVLPYEGENPDCQAQGRGTDQCGNCTGCAPGKILCSGVCVDPLVDTNDPSCDARHRGFNQCTGACTACWSGWYDCDGDPDFICEQNGSLEGTACGGGFGVCQDACCNNCQINQPYVPMGGDFGTPDANDRNKIDSSSYTNPIIYIDHLDPSQNKDYMNFATNGNTEFIVNNKGHLMIGLNSAGAVLGPGENAIYALVEGTAQGNFLLFQKSGAPNDIFSISHDGVICWNGDCRNSWDEVGGGAGAWTLVNGPPDYIYANAVGDFGDAADGGIQITDTGDIKMDGDLTLSRTAGTDDGMFIGPISGAEDYITSHREGTWQNGLFVEADGNVQITLDKNNNEDATFRVADSVGNWVFSVGENGNAEIPYDTNLKVGGCAGSVFLGITSASYDGSLNGASPNGYEAANEICKSEFSAESEGGKYPNIHVCTSAEILKSINCGMDIKTAGLVYARISNGPPGYTAPANDCKGWTDNSGNVLSDIWNFQNNQGWATTCNLSRPFACCK